MILNALKSLKPTVFAYTFLLLIVMNLEQARCNNNKDMVALYHKETHSYLTMHSNGTVSAVENEKNFAAQQCLEFSFTSSQLNNFNLSIYNYATGRYLCFNKLGKLVGRKKCSAWCLFSERFSEGSLGYLQYSSRNKVGKRDLHYFISFNRRGKPPKPAHTNSTLGSTLFIKMRDTFQCKAWKPHSSCNETTSHRKRHCQHNLRRRQCVAAGGV